MSVNTTSQRAFSMLRRMRPSTTLTSNAYLSGQPAAAHRRWLQTTVKPSVVIAKTMPVGMSEMSNETLVTIAALGNHEARCEALIRHIMSVDEVDYDEATTKFQEIEKFNRAGLAVYPYFIGIAGGMVGGFGSLPLVFDLKTAEWFNQFYVTTDVPEPKDLETMLEVGAWTWNWMEPPLGTLSFALLCFQYARAQMTNVGLHPYTSQVIRRRANNLVAAYPQYDAFFIRQFSATDPLVRRWWAS